MRPGIELSGHRHIPLDMHVWFAKQQILTASEGKQGRSASMEPSGRQQGAPFASRMLVWPSIVPVGLLRSRCGESERLGRRSDCEIGKEGFGENWDPAALSGGTRCHS
jgi:hypothetical protein